MKNNTHKLLKTIHKAPLTGEQIERLMAKSYGSLEYLLCDEKFIEYSSIDKYGEPHEPFVLTPAGIKALYYYDAERKAFWKSFFSQFISGFVVGVLTTVISGILLFKLGINI